MTTNTLSILLFCITAFSLTACGGGSSSSGGISAVAVPATISLSGSDTTNLGSTVELNYYAFREDILGADLFLSATSSGSAMNFVRLGLGELSLSDVDMTAIANDEANSVVFNITDIGVSIRINKNGEAYLYSLACVLGCTDVQFDTISRTLTLNDVVLSPTIGGDSNSQAASPLTLNGTIVWAISDENPNAPANSTSSASFVSGTSNVTLPDMVGVWDSSFGNDENYTKFEAGGSYVDFDYQGDAVDMGQNCYEVSSGTIEDLGNGRFSLDEGNRVGTFSFSGDDLLFEAPEAVYTLSISSLTTTDFVPVCN